LAIAFDPLKDKVLFTCCVEIFDVGGKTPPNRHLYATELDAEDLAVLRGKTLPVSG
jgi:hypothetical protein